MHSIRLMNDVTLILITTPPMQATPSSTSPQCITVAGRTLGRSVLGDRTRWHTVADRDRAQAKRGCLGTISKRVRLPYRPPHGAQTCELFLVVWRTALAKIETCHNNRMNLTVLVTIF